MTRKDVKGDQPSGGETTWANTGARRYGRGQHKTGSFRDDMLRPSPNHGTQRLPNDDDDDKMDSKVGYEMRLIVVEEIRGRCASFVILTATVSEIFVGQTNSFIFVE